MGWIHSLYINVIYLLYAARNQSTPGRKEQTLRVIFSQLALIQDPVAHWVYWLASHHGDTSREQNSCSGAQRLAVSYFDVWWNKFCLMQLVLNPRCVPAAAKSTEAFDLQVSSVESTAIKNHIVLLFFNYSINSKITLWTNWRCSISLCITFTKWMAWNKKISHHIKMPNFVGNNLVHSLGENNMETFLIDSNIEIENYKDIPFFTQTVSLSGELAPLETFSQTSCIILLFSFFNKI